MDPSPAATPSAISHGSGGGGGAAAATDNTGMGALPPNWYPLQGVAGCYVTIEPARVLKGTTVGVGARNSTEQIRPIPVVPEKHAPAEMVDRVRDLLKRVDALEVRDASEREQTLARIAEHEKQAAERARKAKEEEEQRRRAAEKAQMEREMKEIELRQAEILRQNQLRKQQEERAAVSV